MSYKFIDHTADIAVQVESDTLEGLFTDAAYAWREAVADRSGKTIKNNKKIKIEEENKEILIVAFLDELNYLLFTKKWLMYKIISLKISKLSKSYYLDAVIAGEEYNKEKILLKEEIKAVTYHNLEITNTINGYKVLIVFDI